MVVIAVAALFSVAAAADPASGTIDLQSKAGAIVVNVANVYLVKGPDAVSGKTMRQLIFTATDLSSKLRACASMMCASGSVTEGMTVDFDAGSRLNYWVVGHGQKIQYSGGVRPAEGVKLSADTPQRLAGTLTFDDSAAAGPKVNVKFDATVLKQFAK